MDIRPPIGYLRRACETILALSPMISNERPSVLPVASTTSIGIPSERISPSIRYASHIPSLSTGKRSAIDPVALASPKPTSSISAMTLPSSTLRSESIEAMNSGEVSVSNRTSAASRSLSDSFFSSSCSGFGTHADASSSMAIMEMARFLAIMLSSL